MFKKKRGQDGEKEGEEEEEGEDEEGSCSVMSKLQIKDTHIFLKNSNKNNNKRSGGRGGEGQAMLIAERCCVGFPLPLQTNKREVEKNKIK